jgi:ADP-L-glycero-D-manno-heptose 6-epimerase
MASVVWHFHNQILENGIVKLFEGCDGYENGEQRRDFIYIQDIVNVNLWFLENPEQKGIFNLGTGISRSFNDVAKIVIEWHKKGKLQYVPFPTNLKGFYQSFTEANMKKLREVGYTKPFTTLEVGIHEYLNLISDTKHHSSPLLI